jgi:hypothetical protein
MKKSRSRSSRCVDISTPTLRKVREGWGTASVIYASEIKGLGHPPRSSSFFIVSAGLNRGPARSTPKLTLDATLERK